MVLSLAVAVKERMPPLGLVSDSMIWRVRGSELMTVGLTAAAARCAELLTSAKEKRAPKRANAAIAAILCGLMSRPSFYRIAAGRDGKKGLKSWIKLGRKSYLLSPL